MAGLQGIKMIGDLDRESDDRRISASQMEWQPFTNQAPQQIRQANPWGDLASGVMTAAVMDQNATDAEWQKSMAERQTSAWERMAVLGNSSQKMAASAADLPPWQGATEDEIRRWQMARY
jgi:hypothetical protein